MEPKDKSRLALSGVRIVDWTIKGAGPSATWILADMGAEIIKVENPVHGDPQRGASRERNHWFKLSNGLTYSFENQNRNKKSIAIDITTEEGKQIIYSLVAKSDAFVQNFRFGVA